MTIQEICSKWLWIQLILVSVIGMFVYNTFVYAENADIHIKSG